MSVLAQKVNMLINKRNSPSPSRSKSESSQNKISQKNKKKGRWTSEEDEMLKEYAPIYSEKQWRKISDHIPGRSAIQCLHRWTKILKPGLIKGPWTQEEDNKLLEWVGKEGATKWAQLSTYIQGRSGKQCRERWFNNLDPEVKKGNWTLEEDDLIFKLYLKHGSSWSKIASFLPGRTENSVKNRFYSTIRKIATDKRKEESDSIKKDTLTENSSSDLESSSRSIKTHTLPAIKNAGDENTIQVETNTIQVEKTNEIQIVEASDIKIEDNSSIKLEADNESDQGLLKIKSQSLYHLLQNRVDILTACKKKSISGGERSADEGAESICDSKKPGKKGFNHKRRNDKSPASLSANIVMEEIMALRQSKPVDSLAAIHESVKQFLSINKLETMRLPSMDIPHFAPCLKKRNIIITTNDDLTRIIKKEQEERKISLLLQQLKFLEQMLCNTKEELTRLETSLVHQQISKYSGGSPRPFQNINNGSQHNSSNNENFHEFLDLSNTMEAARGEVERPERPERQEKPERPGKPERPEKHESKQHEFKKKGGPFKAGQENKI